MRDASLVLYESLSRLRTEHGTVCVQTCETCEFIEDALKFARPPRPLPSAI